MLKFKQCTLTNNKKEMRCWLPEDIAKVGEVLSNDKEEWKVVMVYGEKKTLDDIMNLPDLKQETKMSWMQ